METIMKRHEWWRQFYRQRRYLEHASAEELGQRYQDVMENIGSFSAEGKWALKSPLECQWGELFTHVLEELELRGESPIRPEMLRAGQFTLRKLKTAKRAAEIWQGHDPPLGTYLLKFGKLKHLRPPPECRKFENCTCKLLSGPVFELFGAGFRTGIHTGTLRR